MTVNPDKSGIYKVYTSDNMCSYEKNRWYGDTPLAEIPHYDRYARVNGSELENFYYFYAPALRHYEHSYMVDERWDAYEALLNYLSMLESLPESLLEQQDDLRQRRDWIESGVAKKTFAYKKAEEEKHSTSLMLSLRNNPKEDAYVRKYYRNVDNYGVESFAIHRAIVAPSYSASIEKVAEYDAELPPEEARRQIDYFLSQEIKNGNANACHNKIFSHCDQGQRFRNRQLYFIIDRLRARDYFAVYKLYHRFNVGKRPPLFGSIQYAMQSAEDYGFITEDQKIAFSVGYLTWKLDHERDSQPNRVDESFSSNSPNSSSVGEEALRKSLEKKFQTGFPSVWCSHIVNPETGRPLQLDCYSEKFKIAFEYQGAQHYEPIDIWGGEETLRQIQKRDAIKKQRCKELGITLFEIDDRKFSTDPDKKARQISEHVERLAQEQLSYLVS